jgi:hypothetical protein
LSSPKPFKKRAHRPWRPDLLDDDSESLASIQKTIPIIESLPQKPAQENVAMGDKGKMLIGGFFKPEGLLPDFLSTLPVSDDNGKVREETAKIATPIITEENTLHHKINAFSEKLHASTAIDLEDMPLSSSSSATNEKKPVLDLNNTEALLETILKAKQQEVEKLSEHAFSRVKAMESRLSELDNARQEAVKERVVAEAKLSKIIQQIQKHEEAKNEEMKKRRLVEEKIHDIIKESEQVKKQAEEEVEKAQLNAKMQEEARIAAEKLTEESIKALEQYKAVLKESEVLSEKYKKQSEALIEIKNKQMHTEAEYEESKKQLKAAQDAQRYAEEQFCNLKLEIDTERTAIQLKSEHLDKVVEDKTTAMKAIVGKERELRIELETKLQKLFKKYLALDKAYKAEHQARALAEQRAKQALEQASKAVMHVLSVSNGGIIS